MLQTYGNTNQYAPVDMMSTMMNTQMMMNAMSSMSLNGSPGSSDEACTLFLGDLSVYCTEKDIRKLFRPFGVIEAIRVKRGSSNKTNLSYGFIKFSTKESAEQAMNQLNGVMFLGRTIRIGWAEGKSPVKVPKPKQEKRVETAQVHVSFISKQIDVLISEATIRGLFGLYGEVIDVALKKSQFDKNLKIQNGYGFVHFPLNEEGIKSAITAVNSLHQVTIDRVTYDCSVSHALEPFLQHSKEFGMESFSNNFHSLMQSTKNHQTSPNLPPMSSSHQKEDRIVDPLNLYRPPKENNYIQPPPQHQQHQYGAPSHYPAHSQMMGYGQQPPSVPYNPRMGNDLMMMNGLAITPPSPYVRPTSYAPSPMMNDPLGYSNAAFLAPPPLPMPQPIPQNNNYTYNNFYTQTPGGYAAMGSMPKNQFI